MGFKVCRTTNHKKSAGKCNEEMSTVLSNYVSKVQKQDMSRKCKPSCHRQRKTPALWIQFMY